jgi:hypothetical protein
MGRNLYGIESEADCRAKMDELLAWVAKVEQAPSEQTIRDLKSQLETYYTAGSRQGMSNVEEIFFWPAIQDAYLHAPHVGQPETWAEGLHDIAWYLNYWRPKLVK